MSSSSIYYDMALLSEAAYVLFGEGVKSAFDFNEGIRDPPMNGPFESRQNLKLYVTTGV